MITFHKFNILNKIDIQKYPIFKSLILFAQIKLNKMRLLRLKLSTVFIDTQ